MQIEVVAPPVLPPAVVGRIFDAVGRRSRGRGAAATGALPLSLPVPTETGASLLNTSVGSGRASFEAKLAE